MVRIATTDEITREGVGRSRTNAPSAVVLLDGEVCVQELPTRGEIAIGRSQDAGLIINHASVSRTHAVLDLDLMTITDVGSRNGTTVGGERLVPNVPAPVNAGDTIVIGDVTMIVQREGARAAAVAPVQQLPLELRLAEETARAARQGTPFVHARVEVPPEQADAARELLLDSLRSADVIGEDGPGRFQLLLAAIASERGRSTVQRIINTLGSSGIVARAGVAAYPYDGVTAAQLSARAREQLGVHEGEHSAMDEVMRLAASAAPGEITVLITGETGVGKELVAEMIHRISPRAQRPFLRINCAAIAEPLLESELFGHTRGAFTGADSTRMGLFEAAAGGTVLLDEIGEMGLRLQALLLRVLEERVIRRVGESEVRPVDVRIVCATNRSLLEDVDANRFRRDLYYRISAFTIEVPPLRQRPHEIEAIARAFAALATARTRRAVPTFTEEARRALRTYAWPGNIRELRNAIERAVLLAGDGPIGLAELGLEKPRSEDTTIPPKLRSGDPTALSEELAELERQRIIEALEHFGGNQTHAARALGLSRTTLIARIDQYSLRRPRKR